MDKQRSERSLRALSNGGENQRIAQVCQQVICEEFSMNPSELLGKSRTERVAWARFLAMWLTRDIGKMPFESIGLQFGKDHGTVIHACACVDKERSIDQALNDELLEYEEKIRARLNGK